MPGLPRRLVVTRYHQRGLVWIAPWRLRVAVIVCGARVFAEELRVKRYLRATCLSIGAALMVSIAILTQPSPGALAQAQPSPSPSPAAPAAAPAASPVASPASTSPAPRAGGFPMAVAVPLLAGGAAAVGAGAYLLRRRRS